MVFMNYLISVIIFTIILAIIVYRDRKNFKRESILLLRRTKRGKKSLIELGIKFPRGWKLIGSLAIVVGFFASILAFNSIIQIALRLFTVGVTPAGLALVLPSPFPQAAIGPGYFLIPFWYWIISIALLIVVHEGMHGIMAARERVKIKSLGFGLLAIIPLAFVEPDEKQLKKKKSWQQLRVFASGSFANFLLAGISLIILISLAANLFIQSGIAYQGYPATKINIGDVIKIDNYTISSIQDIKRSLEGIEANETISILTHNGTFLLRKDLLQKQLNLSSLVVFEDYPAVRTNLIWTIIRINNYTIKNSQDLSDVLEKIGINKTVEIITTNGTANKTFILKTTARPYPEFKPDLNTNILIILEHGIPGTIDFSQSTVGLFSPIFGGEKIDWDYIQLKIQFWEYIKNYPKLSSLADKKIEYWNEQLSLHPRPGFVGISGVITQQKLKFEFKFYAEPINFLLGLLFFIFLINLGVGVFNLLPIRGLDGGRMWEIVFQKILPKYTKRIINILGSITLFLIFIILISNIGSVV